MSAGRNSLDRSPRIRQFSTTCALLLALLLAACARQRSDVLGDWNLVSLNGSAPLADTPVTIGFTEDQLGGSAGCNQYAGRYALAGDRLRLEDLVQTEMACQDEALSAQEAAFMEALVQVDRAQVEEDRLTLSGGSAELVFERAAAQQSEMTPN